jgi:hypothetical protein
LDTQRILSELKAERNRLDKAIAVLDGDGTRIAMATADPSTNDKGAQPRRKHHRLTAAGRKRLSLMMKKRWAERRKKSS